MPNFILYLGHIGNRKTKKEGQTEICPYISLCLANIDNMVNIPILSFYLIDGLVFITCGYPHVANISAEVNVINIIIIHIILLFYWLIFVNFFNVPTIFYLLHNTFGYLIIIITNPWKTEQIQFFIVLITIIIVSTNKTN